MSDMCMCVRCVCFYNILAVAITFKKQSISLFSLCIGVFYESKSHYVARTFTIGKQNPEDAHDNRYCGPRSETKDERLTRRWHHYVSLEEAEGMFSSARDLLQTHTVL